VAIVFSLHSAYLTHPLSLVLLLEALIASFTTIMKPFSLVPLLLLLLSKDAASRTWRSPPALKRAMTLQSLTYVPRGGAEDPTRVEGVPVVPEDTVQNSLNLNLQQSLARGGSTATRTKVYSATAGTRSIQQPLPSLSTTTTPPAGVCYPTNATTIVEAEELVLSKKDLKKRLKRHKQIAKKLKVSDERSGAVQSKKWNGMFVV
jgi:hypothetical protein